MRVKHLFITFTLLILVVNTPVVAEFGAYYTRVDSGEEHEKYARVGPHADIVVDLEGPAGKLVFWRGSSYLPYLENEGGKWFIPEIIARKGDGTDKRPDLVNTYSRVKIIESAPTRVIIHWRYLPKFDGTNPHIHHAWLRNLLVKKKLDDPAHESKHILDNTKFIDEYFTIEPRGKSIEVTRVIKQGTAKYGDWVDPKNKITQKLELSSTGISAMLPTRPEKSAPPEPPAGNPLQVVTVATPVKHWKFDEGVGEVAAESIAGDSCPIAGHTSYWKNGVSGRALAFDGYESLVSLPAARAPRIASELTLEAWVAIGAYPWNMAPIIQKGENQGYYLGIGGHGQVGFKANLDGTSVLKLSTRSLERKRWYHIAGVYNKGSRSMAVYIDGVEAQTTLLESTAAGDRKLRGAIPWSDIATNDAPIKIGKGQDRQPTDPVRRNTFADSYSFDGLIDEVRIYDRALSPGQIRKLYESSSPSAAIIQKPDLDKRVLPAGHGRNTFGAYYTHLKFYDTWDGMFRFGNHPDVVVEFDGNPSKFVFWRGVGFIPMLVNENGQWYSNEFNETWNRSGGQGCQEPMSDKEGHTNHARIIENTPARVVIQWRYPLLDVLRVIANYDENTGWGDWSDWYYYIYPNGVAVKTMRLWSTGPYNHEWQEGMSILGPDQHPEQVIETSPALILGTLSGEKREYSWKNGPPRGVDYKDTCIHIVNYKAKYDPFTIGEFRGGNVYSGEVTDYAVFPSWNHWPVAQMPSDGRYASFPDRTAHSSLTHVRLPVYRQQGGPTPYQERLLMEGMSNKSVAELAVLGRSWLHAPEINALSGCGASGYDRGQRAYLLAATSPVLKCRILGSRESPIVNPCLVVRNWGSRDPASLKRDGQRVATNASFRQGTIRDVDGSLTKVIWLQLESTSTVEVEIAGARPDTRRPLKPEWVEAPTVNQENLEIIMKARVPGSSTGLEYFFEEISGAPGASSGWQLSPEFTVLEVSPDTTYSYRVKTRNRFFNESEWSAVKSVKTGDVPGPLAHWSMDQENSNLVRDSLGNHHGTIVGKAAWGTGKKGQGLILDGKSHVLIANPETLNSTQSFTWVAWIKTGKDGPLIGRTGAAREWTQGGKVLFIRRGIITMDVGWVGATRRGQARVSDGQWHHVVLSVKRGSQVAIYVDGRLDSESELKVGTHKENGLPLKIGFCNDDFPREQAGFDGRIDEVSWYGYALNQVMVKELYQAY